MKEKNKITRGRVILSGSFSRFDLAVFLLVLLDQVSDQHKDLAVGASALVIRDHVQFVQHLFFDPYGQAFGSHNIPPH